MSENKIQDHLELLANNKDAIKNAIITKGQVVSDIDPFSTYAGKILNIQTSSGETGGPTVIDPDVLAMLQAQVNSVGTQVLDISAENDNLRNCVNDIMAYCQSTVGSETGIELSSIEEIITSYGFSNVYRTIQIRTNKDSVVTLFHVVDGEEKAIRTYTASRTPTQFRVAPGEYKVTSTLVREDDVYSDSSTITVGNEDIVYSVKITHVPMGSVTYGIEIDTSNNDPDASVTYIEQADSFEPLSVNLSNGVCNYGDWQDAIENWFGIKPCLVNPSNLDDIQYLNPDDYTKLEDGSPSNITTTSKLAMVEFAQRWYRWSVDEDNDNILRFEVSNYDRSDEGFTQAAFKSYDGSGDVMDAMYYGIYEGNNVNNKLDSKSGAEPAGNITIGNYRTYAKANGTNFGIEDYSKRYYVMGLLYLVTKSRYLQGKLGNGNMGSSAKIKNGTMDKKGLFYGGTAAGVGVKVFGIENFWGNTWNWLDGIVTTGSGGLKFKECGPYSDAGNDYTVTHNAGFTGWNWPKKFVPIMNGAAIAPTSELASDTSGTKDWCDQYYVYSSAGYVADVGGDYGVAPAGYGPASVAAGDSASDTGASVSARVCGVA